MSTMFGADVAQLRALAQQFDHAADRLEQDRMTVGNAIQIRAWFGPVAVRFRHEWDSEHSRRVLAASQRLRTAAQSLRSNAEEQDRASAVDNGAGGGGSSSDAGKEPSLGPAPNGTRDFVRNLAEMDDDDDGVRVQKVRGEDGVYRYIVYISGSGSTEDGDWGGRLGWDNNLSAINSLDSKTLNAIRARIAESIDDPTAEVAIVGFSQGGMIAQRLADESAFNIKTVLTYGSPVISDARNFGGADVIRLVHNFDPVPVADGRNPVNVVLTPILDAVYGNTPPPSGEDVTFAAGGPKWGAHNSDDYEWVAEQFDKSDDGRFDAAKNSLRRFAGDVIIDEK